MEAWVPASSFHQMEKVRADAKVVLAGAALCAKAAWESWAAFLSLENLARLTLHNPRPVLSSSISPHPVSYISLVETRGMAESHVAREEFPALKNKTCSLSRPCLPFPPLAHKGKFGAPDAAVETHWCRSWQWSEPAPLALAPHHLPFVCPQTHFLLLGEPQQHLSPLPAGPWDSLLSSSHWGGRGGCPLITALWLCVSVSVSLSFSPSHSLPLSLSW